MGKKMCRDSNDQDDKCQNGDQQTGYVESDTVLGLRRGLGDTEEIDEESGDIAEDEHRS